MENFPGAQGPVAVLHKMLRQRDLLRRARKTPKMLAVGAVPVDAGGRGAEPGQHGSARRVADRRGTVGVCEQHPAIRQPVKIRRLRIGMTAQTAGPVVEIVHRDKQHVWAILRLGSWSRRA
jgi:hypothetical protein